MTEESIMGRKTEIVEDNVQMAGKLALAPEAKMDTGSAPSISAHRRRMTA